MMNVYRLDNLKDRKVDWDYQNLYTWMGVMPVRNMYKIEAKALLERGDTAKCVNILNKITECMPTENFPYNFSLLQSVNEYTIIDMVELYLKCGKAKEGMQIASEFIDETIKSVQMFGSNHNGTVLSADDYQANMMYLYYLRRCVG